LFVVTLASAAGIAVSARQIAPRNTLVAADPRGLPDGPGRDLVTSRCLTCHADTLIREQRLGAPAWGREVDKMIAWGAVLEPAQRAQVVTYLAEHFESATSASASDADEASGLVSRCLGCHDTRLIEEQRLSVAGWRREIDKMAGWGANLSEPERDRLSDYLSRRYPR
jgi:cytochrome c5